MFLGVFAVCSSIPWMEFTLNFKTFKLWDPLVYSMHVWRIVRNQCLVIIHIDWALTLTLLDNPTHPLNTELCQRKMTSLATLKCQLFHFSKKIDNFEPSKLFKIPNRHPCNTRRQRSNPAYISREREIGNLAPIAAFVASVGLFDRQFKVHKDGHFNEVLEVSTKFWRLLTSQKDRLN